MKNKFNINQVEDINIPLDVVIGLSQTATDLLSQHIALFTEYPSSDKGIKYRADRLATQLTALSSAITDTTEKAQEQLNKVVTIYYKDGVNND